MDEAPPREQVLLLLDRIGRREEPALRELHALFAPRIYAFAMHRLRDHHDAETVAVDTLYDVWKKPAAFRGESRFSTWLMGIAHHKVLTLLRQRRGHQEDIDDHAAELSAPEPGPDVEMEDDERRRLLAACMQRLDDFRRQCLHLVFVEGMSLADVALIQQIPVNTVKTRLFHARRKLQDCVQRRVRAEAM
jgi:RNA polymerase sigma-70 factor, ECF subfamily